jgi:hypothetical protein
MPGDGLTHGPPATKKAGGSHHRFSRITTGIPRAMVLTAYSALSPVYRTGVPGFLATVARRSPPASLIPASGDQDHAILPSASMRFVVAHERVHRISRHVS